MIAAISEMVNNGVSARKVEKVTAGISIDRISSSQISRICKMLNAQSGDQEKNPYTGHLLISQFSLSVALLVRIRFQCSMGNFAQARISFT